MAELKESLAALERVLEAEPGLAPALTPEQVETRVERIIAQTTRSAYDEAAQASEALLGEGVRDVRLVTPYLFGAFLAHGPQILSALLSTLHHVFTRGWEQFGPGGDKTGQADSSLCWLFKSLCRHLEFNARARDDMWRKWCESCSQPQLQEALQRASELGVALEQLLPGRESIHQLLKLRGWLSENLELFLETTARPEQAQAAEQEKEDVRRERGQVVAMRVDVTPPKQKEEESPEESPEEPKDAEPSGESKDEAPPEAPESEAPPEDPKSEEEVPLDEPADKAPPEDPKSEEEAPPEVSSAPPGYSPPLPELKHSPALEQLLHKLAAFDRLMERQDFSRASVVAKDVLHVIDHFDPLVYLPSLFCRFLSSLSAHGGSIEPLMQGTRSLSDGALERLYRIGLEAFMSSTSGAEDKP
jgi:hypothetical protein